MWLKYFRDHDIVQCICIHVNHYGVNEFLLMGNNWIRNQSVNMQMLHHTDD